MTPGTSDSTSHTHRVRLRLGSMCITLSLVSVGFASCSVENNYETLSYFFDGVPKPGSNQPIIVDGETFLPVAAMHSPYADSLCDQCHETKFGLGTVGGAGFTIPKSTVCLKCHKDVQTEHQSTHAPVLATACLICHSPHQSNQIALLRAPPSEVCARCHERESLFVDTVPAHADTSKSCISCHSGHGSDNRFFLLNNPTTIQGDQPKQEQS